MKSFEMRVDADEIYRPDARQLREDAMQHYNMTVAMLNKSMGLCLR
jgi:hypothetical protein